MSIAKSLILIEALVDEQKTIVYIYKKFKYGQTKYHYNHNKGKMAYIV